MIQSITPSNLSGTIRAIPSKSAAHRLLICAALSGEPTEIECQGTSKDIEATKACLAAMQSGCKLPCGESGSTLRFLLPVAAALGLDAEFYMEGRLPQRPLHPLDEQLTAHGVTLTRPQPDILKISGKLAPGALSQAIETGDRLDLGVTAPAHGLTLMEVFYSIPDTCKIPVPPKEGMP